MAADHHMADKPWRPMIEREPEFNPFVNPVDPSGGLEELPLPEMEVSDSSEGEQKPGVPADPKSTPRP
jgi:hypothetical protein